MKRPSVGTALIGVLTIALLVRLPGVGWDLPRVYHPDEPLYIGKIINMLQTGDLNPHWFQYPSLFLYILLPIATAVCLLRVAQGHFVTVDDLISAQMVVTGTGSTDLPELFLLGRLTMTLSGVLTIYLIYRLGREMFGAPTAVLAALLLALTPTHVLAGHYYRPDALVALLALASVYVAWRAYRNGRLVTYLTAGLLTGLTAAAKYNGGLVLVALWTAHFLAGGRLRDGRLWLTTLCAGFGFFLGTPFALLDTRAWLDGMLWEVRHYYVVGHAGAESESGVLYFSSKLLATLGLAPLLALTAVAVDALQRRREMAMIATFPLLYFILITSPIVHPTIALTPLLPPLALLAARGFMLVVHPASNAQTHTKPSARIVSRAIWPIALILALMSMPTVHTVRTVQQFIQPEVRTLAEEWMNANLPAGARVVAESYSPLLGEHFEVNYVGRLIDHQADWYTSQEVDYLIASSAMYGRFFSNEARYKDETTAYNQLFNQFKLLAEVHGPFKLLAEPEGVIRIYQVR